MRLREMDPDRAGEEAARPTLKRIERARRYVSPDVAKVLDDIVLNLFVPGYGAKELAQAFSGCDRGGNLWKTFAAELGRPVASYILLARLETSVRLLRDTDLKVAQISRLLGFEDAKDFRTAFWRYLGVWPQDFRRAARRIRDRAGRPGLEVLSVDLWEQLDEGRLEPEEGRRLALWFKIVGSTQEANAELAVKEIWKVLEPLPPVAQHHLLRHEIRCDLAALDRR